MSHLEEIWGSSMLNDTGSEEIIIDIVQFQREGLVILWDIFLTVLF